MIIIFEAIVEWLNLLWTSSKQYEYLCCDDSVYCNPNILKMLLSDVFSKPKRWNFELIHWLSWKFWWHVTSCDQHDANVVKICIFGAYQRMTHRKTQDFLHSIAFLSSLKQDECISTCLEVHIILCWSLALFRYVTIISLTLCEAVTSLWQK